MALVDTELENLKTRIKQVEGATLEAAVRAMVRVKLYKSDNKNLVACFQFPENYPEAPILLELKSKVIKYRILEGLSRICEDEAKKLVGQQQIIPLLKFIMKYIDDNPLIVCGDEIKFIKQDLLRESDEAKLKQKTSQVIVKLKEKAYYITVKMSVPEDYPLSKLGIEITDQNFPTLLKTNYSNQAIEIARRCVQPPIKPKPKDPPWEPKPALRPVVEYLVTHVISKLPNEICPICQTLALPEDPSEVIENPKADKYIERVYCGHLYHRKCMDTYLKTPPFAGGKKCPSCGNRIFHEKWKAPPELVEARWAHQEARRREISEVVDFLE